MGKKTHQACYDWLFLLINIWIWQVFQSSDFYSFSRTKWFRAVLLLCLFKLPLWDVNGWCFQQLSVQTDGSAKGWSFQKGFFVLNKLHKLIPFVYLKEYWSIWCIHNWTCHVVLVYHFTLWIAYMVTTVTKIFLDKVFRKEENTYRIFTLEEGIFLCVSWCCCHKIKFPAFQMF